MENRQLKIKKKKKTNYVIHNLKKKYFGQKTFIDLIYKDEKLILDNGEEYKLFPRSHNYQTMPKYKVTMYKQLFFVQLDINWTTPPPQRPNAQVTQIFIL